MLGRTAVLLGLTLSIATFFGVAIIIGSRPDQPAKFLLAVLLTAIVSAPVGWVIAALIPRELEGSLILIGIMGIEISVPNVAAQYLPLYAPLTLTDADIPYTGGLLAPTLHAIAYGTTLATIALLLWWRRVRVPTLVQPRTDPLAHYPSSPDRLGQVGSARRHTTSLDLRPRIRQGSGKFAERVAHAVDLGAVLITSISAHWI